MKKIGKFYLIKENICKLTCNCGWNITIGGRNKEDLKDLKRYLAGEPLKVNFYKNKMKKELTEQQIKAMIDLVYETTKNGKQMLKRLKEDYRSLEKVFNKKIK